MDIETLDSTPVLHRYVKPFRDTPPLLEYLLPYMDIEALDSTPII
jgi:hypothetical protein